MKKIRTNAGFTLTEVLIVVGIIMFLVFLTIVFFRLQILKGNDARRKGDLHEIQVAVEEYEKDNNCYPLPLFVICNPGAGLKPYVSKIPCDPITKASYYYEYDDSSCPKWYRLYTKLENENDQDIMGTVGPSEAFNFYLSSPNAPSLGGGNGGGNGGNPPADFYGCRSGICVPILWDPTRPGPECDPNFRNSNCYGQCGPPSSECTPWN